MTSTRFVLQFLHLVNFFVCNFLLQFLYIRTMKAETEKPTRTITFQPDPLSDLLLKKAVAVKGQIRGMRSHLINKAIHLSLKEFAGKREQSLIQGK